MLAECVCIKGSPLFHINAVTSIEDVTFSDIIRFTDINHNDGIRDVIYNQCISKHVRILDIYLSLGRITWAGEFLPKGKTQDFIIWRVRIKKKNHYDEVRGNFLRPQNSTLHHPQ